MIALLRKLVIVMTWPFTRRFKRALNSPENTQFQLLEQITRDLSQCEYGRTFGLKGGETLAQFRSLISINTYETLEPWIERQRIDGLSLLNPSPVDLYEKTSGSSGIAKYIPYTRLLRRGFSSLAMLWMSDLCRHAPRLESGKIFMSISPAFPTETQTQTGVPIGLSDDTDYLPPALKKILGHLLITPPELKKITQPEDYRWVLSCALLAAENLEVISIWNPTYFSAILKFIEKNAEALQSDLRAGITQRGGVEFRFQPVSQIRLAEIKKGTSIAWTQVWPSLRLISAWNEGSAEAFAQELMELFPGVYFQGKGLLATECPMTFPMMGAPAGVPLLNHVFFEFLDEFGQLHLLHELKDGQDYEMIVTPRGGFCRYRIGDRVRVRGKIENTPCLSFRGRSQNVSDMVGEKLNEIFIRSALESIPELKNKFYVVIPLHDARPPRYALVVDAGGQSIDANRVDAVFSEAVHYRYARQLEQLGAVQILEKDKLEKIYYDHFIERGMKWGDIKYSALIHRRQDGDALLQKIRD